MARAEYYVVHYQGQWKIKHGDTYYGPYGTQQEAINVAVDTAKRSYAAGHNSQVHVQGQNSQFRTEYTYGSDPKRYPG